MPFYTQLKIRSSDSDTAKRKKKRVAAKVQKLKKELAKQFANSRTSNPTGSSVRIATFNIREFGGSKYGGRGYEELYYLAEMISSFQIVALQEVRSDLKEFGEMLRILGPDWDYLATDVTDGSAGNSERMVFLFNQRRVRFRNIAGELTLDGDSKIRASFGERIFLQEGLQVRTPGGIHKLSGTYKARLKSVTGGKALDSDIEIPLPAGSTLELPDGVSFVVSKNTRVTSPGRGKASVKIPRSGQGKNYRLKFPDETFEDSLRQFARTPYLVSFQVDWLKINLCTVHLYFGSNENAAKLEQRRSEIEELAKGLARKAKGEFEQDANSFLAVLGDFNIISKTHHTMAALESNGFKVPEELKRIPGSNVKKDKSYDQIAFWKPDENRGYASLRIVGANVFDYFKYIYKKEEEDTYRAEAGNGLKPTTKYLEWRTYKASDHLVMWTELQTDFSEDYLKSIG